jgi:putative transposase
VDSIVYTVDDKRNDRATLKSQESFNGKLRDELLNGEVFSSVPEAKVLTDAWRRHYNHRRPHSALGYRPPAPVVIKPKFAATS